MDFTQIIAILALFPCGASMAMLMHIGSYDAILGSKFIWVHILGMLAAVLTAFTVTAPRFRHRKLKYHQFACLLVAAVSHIIAGSLFKNLDIFGGFVFASIAHGITLIATPSYLTFRCTARARTPAIASAFTVYVVGVAAMMNLLMKPFYSIEDALNIFHMFITPGIILTVLILFVSVIQRCTKQFDYKQPLDDLVKTEAASNLLLASKVEVIRHYSPQMTPNASEWSTLWWKTLLMIFPRGMGAMLFSLALLFAVGELVYYEIYSDIGIDLLLWLAAAGAAVGTLASLGASAKWIFLTAGGFALLAGVLTTVLSIVEDMEIVAAYSGMGMYFCLGILYPLTHSMLIEIGHLRFSEAFLAVGYILEMVILAVMQQHNASLYYSLYTGGSVGIAMCVWASCSIGFVYAAMPKTFNLSIVSIRNFVWRVKLCSIPQQQFVQQLPQAPPMQQHQPPPPGYWVPQQQQNQQWNPAYAPHQQPMPYQHMPHQQMPLQNPYYNMGPNGQMPQASNCVYPIDATAPTNPTK